MRLILALSAVVHAQMSVWNAAWAARATLIGRAALAGLVAAATYKALSVLF